MWPGLQLVKQGSARQGFQRAHAAMLPPLVGAHRDAKRQGCALLGELHHFAPVAQFGAGEVVSLNVHGDILGKKMPENTGLHGQNVTSEGWDI